MAQNEHSAIATGEKEKHVAVHKFLIHHKGDQVGVATSDIKEGEKVIGVFMDDNSSIEVVANGDIPLGHKIALENLATNEPVLKYGVPIGLTTTEWQVGDYVHTHNIKTARW
ncbi:UxaA family hydrolase [Thalassobacillus pellis]|uniref:UxaA family hydrolase n=1 Tax=Thalassobacillus pellis TaxID=748008 RepID=UPI00195F3C5D|nr:UxaA family hydrolase [Thalassobacillus pellis]MBM7554466.1 (2R)-sulfolactate sulfo-lyase subunit alpha [Thalassobacillus pellis]